MKSGYSVQFLLIGVILLLAIFIASSSYLLVNQPQTTNNSTVSSYTVVIDQIQKGENTTEEKVASDESQFFMSGYRFELSEGWQHIKNILGIKDTRFISNYVNVDATTVTNGDSTQVFYVNKGEYTFYVSNQFITEDNLFDQEGHIYTEILYPNFASDGVYVAYSAVYVANPSAEDVLIKKQMYTCPYNLKNVCIVSGILPLTVDENRLAVKEFYNFVNSLKIYEQN